MSARLLFSCLFRWLRPLLPTWPATPVLLALLAVLCASALGAWDWPVRDPDVSVSFLAADRNGYHNGLVISSRSSAVVTAAEAGTIVFAAEQVARPHRTRLPHVLGGLVIMEHANHMRTVYGNVRPTVAAGRPVAAGGRIAQIDTQRLTSSAHRERGVNVMLLDNRRRRFLNPLLIFPRLPDRLRPSIYFFTVTFHQSPILGAYFNVYVGTSDRRVFSQAVTPVLPPFVAVSYGSERKSIFLDAIHSDGYYWYNSATGLVPRDIFTDDGEFVIGPFILDQQNEIMEIHVSDYRMLSRVIRTSIYEDE